MANLCQEQVKKIIIEGYVNILKRWPDKSGMAHYSPLLISGDLDPEQFYDILISSDEYREKFGSLIAIPNIAYAERPIQKIPPKVEKVSTVPIEIASISNKAVTKTEKVITIDKPILVDKPVDKTVHIEEKLVQTPAEEPV